MNAFSFRRAAARATSFSAVAAAVLALTACYVVPIDPRTGQPYPTPSRESVNAPGYSVPPPAPEVAAQPPMPTLINVRLYPLNAQANKGGLLAAQVVDNNSGHGTFTVSGSRDPTERELTCQLPIDSGSSRG